MDDVLKSLAVKEFIVGSYANASLPSNSPNGTIAYDSTNNKLMIRANGGWETVTSA